MAWLSFNRLDGEVPIEGGPEGATERKHTPVVVNSHQIAHFFGKLGEPRTVIVFGSGLELTVDDRVERIQAAINMAESKERGR